MKLNKAEPDEAYLELASRIVLAGKDRLAQEQRASFTDPDSLADALIDAGCRAVQAEDMHQHGNRLAKGSLGSQAQSVMERVHQQPEPRVAQLVRQRVQAEWLQGDERLNRLADTVIRMAMAEGAPAVVAADDPEAAARQALDIARRQLAAAEGNHVSAGGDAAEVDAAYDTFDPPIRRHALADIVVHKLRQQSRQHKLASSQPMAASLEAEL